MENYYFTFITSWQTNFNDALEGINETSIQYNHNNLTQVLRNILLKIIIIIILYGLFVRSGKVVDSECVCHACFGVISHTHTQNVFENHKTINWRRGNKIM